MQEIEMLFQSFEHTIAAIAAFGTLGAVVVSLWLAHQASRPRLRVFADTGWYIPSEAQRTGQVNFDLCKFAIHVDLTNQGSVPIYITYWAFSWGSHSWIFPEALLQNPWQPDFRSQPIVLQPGQSTSISLTDNLTGLHEEFNKLCERTKRPGWFRRFLRLRVSTQSGYVFKAELGRNMKRILCGDSEALQPPKHR